MDSSIVDFNQDFYITAIRKLVLYLSHVRIFGTHHCGNKRQEAFKRRPYFQDMLCRSDYEKRVVASFEHQIKSEYYGGNRSVSIEVFALEHFSATYQEKSSSSSHSHTHHTAFH